jgi:hypothetical protein
MAQAQLPKDGPDELGMVIGNAIAAANLNYNPKDDPPVPSSGYWDYDESTGMKYWVNYFNTKPKSKADLEFYSLDPDELKRFQELAFQAGLYGPAAERGDIPYGAFDEKTFQIWEQYNERAARGYKVGKNFTAWDYLQDDVNKRPENLGKDRKKRPPLITQLPDPRDVEEMVRGVAPSVIGRDADPAFTSDFIAMYTKIVSDFQANKYALEGTEEGGTLTAPPNAEDLAKFRLRTENPEAFAEKQSVARQQAYLQLLKGAL